MLTPPEGQLERTGDIERTSRPPSRPRAAQAEDLREHGARGAANDVKNSWVVLADLPRVDIEISDIDFDFENPNVLYVAYSSSLENSSSPIGTNMIYRVDYTDPANPVTQDLTGTTLPNTGVGSEAMALERGSDGGIYLATDLGVYYSNNKSRAVSGSGWQLFGANLPHSECRGLEINYQVNRLRAGMNGRGLWEHDLWCPAQEQLVETGAYLANAFIEVQNDVISIAQVATPQNVSYRAGITVHLMPGFHAEQGAYFHAFIHSCEHGGNSYKMAQVAASYGPKWDNESVAPHDSRAELFPNPNDGSFRIRKDEHAGVKDVWATDAAGRRLMAAYKDQGSTVLVLLHPVPPGSLIIVHVQYKDARVEHFKTAILE